MERKVEIYDTTLRDGAQMKGISFSLTDKIKIVQLLDEIGIDYIEGGWPNSNPKDKEFFEKASLLNFKNAKITAFSMTCRKGKNPEEDDNLKELLLANVEIITLVGKSWDLQVEKILGADLKENLRMIEESCKFFSSQGKRVFYDAEHFFDGFKSNQNYALKTLQAAVKGGAERIILCDTNGGALPWEIKEIVLKTKRKVCIPLGIHTHNDEGLAVANSIIALKEGAVQVQGTINGYGERCGNADLCSIIPILELKMGFRCLKENKITELVRISRCVSEIANLKPNPSQPFVGKNAFTHKGGMHVDAMTKFKKSYEHIDPTLIGNFSKIVVSELSGKANILNKANEFGVDLSIEETKKVLEKVKHLENKGFQFDGANASLELLMRKAKSNYKPPFKVLDFTVLEQPKEKENFTSKAMVKLSVNGKIIFSAAEGNGPVNALDVALRKALFLAYPQIKKIHLTDYKVRILNEKSGTAAQVRVLIDSSSNGNVWTTIGSSTDIIKASWQAIIESLEYALIKHIV
ncbi:MAG TPA: citramalate synthase [Candidatus Pacearchaeota archaeon]|nr:citramalate synthase [Candidatus Pacearchaeota archaeon]